ncbi:MAG TPA: 5-methyltetrahydropteroyltriglutamate--homocysteine S-methyltransferase [Burkholderiales bacterium]|jgi:5-methyltetrahydropteroyltriglutamate--homocysteine methyltransferase|nr:5-methyltetrahydropteroyltriglutamate--homocysteine S-methyltransferase [Burkholderiales bacterium]
MKPPFRADHVGSLLRPRELHEARARAKKGEITQEQLKAVQERCIKQVIALQESIGIPSVTDGEFRRDWWHIDFLHGFDGVELAKGDAYGDAKFKGTDEQPPFMLVESRIRRTRPNMLEHFKFLKANVSKGTPKFTMPSPAMLHARADRASIKKTYPDLDNFWADLTQCYREEIADLYKAGCRYLQIDDTTIAMFGDPKVQEQFRKLGDDPKRDVALYAEAVNAAIRDVPDDMAVCIHTCRGNFKSTWLASGSYDYVAETAFSKIDVDGFFLEFDTDRAGGFEPLRYIPKGKKVVLGLVSSKVPQLEAKDQLKQRIEQASKFVPMENLCLSPQCGFSSTHHGNNLTEEQEKAKLRLCIETAREVWGG